MAATMGTRWDLRAFFPELGGAEQRRFQEDLERDANEFWQQLESQKDTQLSIEALADIVLRLEELEVRLAHLVTYAVCARSENVNDEEAQKLSGKASELEALCHQVEILLVARIRDLDEASFQALKDEPRLQQVSYYLERLRHTAKYSMEPDLEALNADLSISGFAAWERLYDNVAGRLEFDYTNSAGETQHTSMNSKMSLLEDPDPQVRKSTLENSNAAWQQMGETISACLNSISGYRLKLLDRRGVKHHLDNAAFESGLNRRTLEVMHETAAQYREVMRDYLKTKAQLCNLPILGFQDQYASVSMTSEEKTYTWEEGRDLVLNSFAAFAPEFAEFAREMIESNCIDSQDHAGKVPGGFCISSPLISQSRILMTYRGNYGDISTLAHEIGHAWHECLMRDIRFLARQYPMTLAETASTFAERLLGDYVLKQPGMGVRERITMLTRRLDDGVSYLLNIPMRFEFEDKLYNERRQGELSLRRLQELMCETQLEIYGDALDPQQLDAWFWASKGHFYTTDISFYNFPYTFGYLFSMGVYARALREGSAFLPRYKELLRTTGVASCEGVAQQVLGVDLEQPDFWRESLQLVERDYRELLELLKQL